MRGRSTVIIIVFLWSMVKTMFLPESADAYQTAEDLTALTIEDLMSIEITSVAKKAQNVYESAAAVFVITQEDIRRSGVRSIAEALRMAPGVEVARIDANKWAITIRGFNSRFANKILVLIDGRTVYTPLFSGVFWDVQDTMLEDIERIEVIRGPGAALWGANAVNGVVNIITKDAQRTQGGLLTVGGGTEERGFGALRYGAEPFEGMHLRGYAQFFNRDEFVDPSQNAAADDWRVLRGGFRLDWTAGPLDVLTLQGDLYDGEAGVSYRVPLLTPPYERERILMNDTTLRGGNLLARWRHEISGSSGVELQVYYDRAKRSDVMTGERRDTLDIDFQHRFVIGNRNDIVWGLGYRYTRDRIENTPYVSFDPDRKTLHLASVFIQDEIRLIEDRLRLIIGSKFEYQSYAKFNMQPNIRLLWTPHERHTLWTSLSRAVRTPARAERGSTFDTLALPPREDGNPFPLPVRVLVKGSRDFDSEDLIAYEAGYRGRVAEKLFVDIAGFYYDYQHLRAADSSGIYADTTLSIPTLTAELVGNNLNRGRSYGIEGSMDWLPLSWLRIQAYYAYFRLLLRHKGDTLNPFNEQAEGLSPRHQASLRSSFDISRHFECDVWIKFVDKLPMINADRRIDLSVRLGWMPLKNLEISMVGQNLLDGSHYEFSGTDYVPVLKTEVQRGVYGKITWKF